MLKRTLKYSINNIQQSINKYKVNKTKKILSFSGIALIAVIIGAYLLFSDSTLCKSIDVEILGDTENHIIDEEHIKKIVLGDYPSIIGDALNTVNLSDLENKIESYPAVKNAEVYTKINGVLAIKLEQRMPIVRIMPIKGNDFYLGLEGLLMPVSNIGSARVLVVNGNVNFDYKNNRISIEDTTVTEKIKEIYKISKVISEDEFLTAQTTQVFVKPNGEYELIPTVGNHIVLFGKINNYEKKLKYLKHFYLNILKNEGWRKYKHISLKYNNQLVCTLSDKD